MELRDKRIMVNVETLIFAVLSELAVKQNKSNSTYVRQLIIKDLLTKGLITEKMLTEMLTGDNGENQISSV